MRCSIFLHTLAYMLPSQNLMRASLKYFFKFTYHVHKSIFGIIKQHTRTSVTHYAPYLLTHLWFVTMNRATLTSSLCITILTPRQAGVSILQERLAFIAKLRIAFILTAVQSYHALYHSLFLLNLHTDESLLRIMSAASVPGTHPHNHSRVTITTEPQPR